MPIIDVLIPAFNEEQSIGKVIADIPSFVRHIVVVNNNSKDNTAAVAEEAGAIVVDQPNQGYGNACLKGMEYLSEQELLPEILVFLDADYSDYPEQMMDVLTPILEGKADLVIGSRALGNREGGSMTLPQVFGNWLATRLMKLLFRSPFSDLGPFRAIKWESLMMLEMEDKNYGWTIEMQIKALQMGLNCEEVPVDYRNRIGTSKVSGTVKGVIGAGYKILWTIAKYSFGSKSKK